MPGLGIDATKSVNSGSRSWIDLVWIKVTVIMVMTVEHDMMTQTMMVIYFLSCDM